MLPPKKKIPYIKTKPLKKRRKNKNNDSSSGSGSSSDEEQKGNLDTAGGQNEQ